VKSGLVQVSTAFVYTLSTTAPFVAIDVLGMSSANYGFANVLPSIGLFAGTILSARLIEIYPLETVIRRGMIIATMGVIFMFYQVYQNASPVYSIFVPMIFIYCGLACVMANTSTIAMSSVHDKAHGAAMMSFINMGLATLVVLGLGYLPISVYLIPTLFIIYCVVIQLLFLLATKAN
jgi:hypothetical protein